MKLLSRTLKVSTLFAAGCLSVLAAPTEVSSWQGKMKSLAETLGELLPELASKQGDPQIIAKSAKSLADLSHDLKGGTEKGKLMPPSDSDPSIPILAGQFADQTHRAYWAIKQGYIDYGKNLLRSVTSNCIACHTRHDNGPEFSNFPLSNKVNSLGKEEKAELWIATRQFDKALGLLNEIIADQNLLKQRPFDWEKSLREAMSIAVRVKKSPEAAAKTVAIALNSTALPDFEKKRLASWQKAIEAWKKEPAIKANTEVGHSTEMKRLYQEAKRGQGYPIDGSADIQYLRISAAAHEFLRSGSNSKMVAEALLTAGIANEVLAFFSPSSLHELYYEACVRKQPHSPLAEDCYSRLERSVYFGYTGSAGTFIPEDVQKQLTELNSLAKPVTKVSKGTRENN